MKRILISFLALALCAAAFPFLLADAQEGPGRPNSSPRAEKTLDQLVRKYERLRLNPAEAARSVRAGGRLHLATAEHSFELELRPNDMRAEDYRAEETGAGSLPVTAGASCAWTAKSNASWIVVTAGASATGSKTVNYTVAANPAMTPRIGTLTVAGKTYTVTQLASVGVKSLTLNNANVPGGRKITGTVALNLPAPAEGAVVVLADNLAAATVPASVTVPAGKTSAAFTITTVVTTGVQTGNVTASYNVGAASAPLTVRPAVFTAFKLSTASVPEGTGVTAAFTLDGPAPPTGAVVTLSDTLPAAGTPASVTIPSGASTKTLVIPTTAVSASQTGVVTAAYAGVSKSAPLTVRPVGVAGLALTPDTVLGGNVVQGLVILEGKAPKNVSVTLTENLASASAPASLVVPAGAASVPFTVTTTAVTSQQTGVLTAAAQGVAKSRFNGDGKTDIARGRRSVKTADILLGRGTGLFNAPLAVNLTTTSNYVEPHEVAVGDFNRDGKQDLAFSQYFTVAVVLGDGKGYFGTPAFYSGAGYENELVVKDMNGDGNEDLVTLNVGPSISIFPGDGTGKFGAPFLVNTPRSDRKSTRLNSSHNR
jgi:hypothetical protein